MVRWNGRRGNETPEILLSRFLATSQGQMFDIFDDMREHPDHMRWFKENAPTQATYRKLIYLLLFLRLGKEPSIGDIREYQINSFGRKSSNHAVLELMPLPSKTIDKKDWRYGDLGIEELSTRKKYLTEFKSDRVELFRSLVEEHKPKLVIFYSLGYIKDWQKIAETPFTEIIPKKLSIAQRDGTTFVVVPHSVARGHSDEVWKTIAEGIISAHPFSVPAREEC